MSNRKRGDEFAKYVALELKGRIVSRGFTAKAVAEGIGRPSATFNRWLNNKLPLPLSVLCEAAEFIDCDPQEIVSLSYDRLAVRYGERHGAQYGADDHLYVDDEIALLEELNPDSSTANVSGTDEDGNPKQRDHALAARKRTGKRYEENHD